MTEKKFKGPYTVCVYFVDLKKDWSIYKQRDGKQFHLEIDMKKIFLMEFTKILN